MTWTPVDIDLGSLPLKTPEGEIVVKSIPDDIPKEADGGVEMIGNPGDQIHTDMHRSFGKNINKKGGHK